jgi:hypothetical protein
MREGLPWHSGVRRVDLAGGAGRADLDNPKIR